MLLCRVVGYKPFIFTTFKEQSSLGRERSNSLWGDSSGETNPLYLSSPLGQLRPLYLKLQPNHEQFLLTRSSDDIRRNSFSVGVKKESDNFNEEGFTEVRLLTPTILREKVSEPSHQNGKASKMKLEVQMKMLQEFQLFRIQKPAKDYKGLLV